MTTAYSRIRGSMGNGYENNAGLVEDASAMAGIDPALMKAIGMAESKFIVNAKNPYGTASGLFQFTNDTWRGSMARYAKELGIPSNAHQFDPKANALLTAYAIRDYQDNIVKNGREITATDVYANHFLGTGGYSKFAKVLNSNPNAPVSAVLSPKAIKDNKIYTLNKDGSLKTVSEMYDALSAKVGNVTPTQYTPRPSQNSSQVAEQNLRTKLAEEYLLSGYKTAWDTLNGEPSKPYDPYESNPLMKYLSTPNQPQQEQPKEVFNASQVAEENLKKYGLNPTTARNREDFERSLGIKNYVVNGGGIDPASINRVAQLAVNAKQASIDHIRNTDKLAQAQFGYGQAKDKMETELGIAKLLAGASSSGTGSSKGNQSSISNQLTLADQFTLQNAEELSNPNVEKTSLDGWLGKYRKIHDTGHFEYKNGKLSALDDQTFKTLNPINWLDNGYMQRISKIITGLGKNELKFTDKDGKTRYVKFEDMFNTLTPSQQTALTQGIDKIVGDISESMSFFDTDPVGKDGKDSSASKVYEQAILPFIYNFFGELSNAQDISLQNGTKVGDNKFNTNVYR